MQIPGGWAAQLYGGRLMLIICFSLWSLACCLTPTSASNTYAIIVARIFVGVAQGFLIPSVHTVLSQVRPCSETNLHAGHAYRGMQMQPVAA